MTYDSAANPTLSAPLLSASEEIDLARTIEAGVLARERLERDHLQPRGERAELAWLVREGAAAHRRLVESNLRLVIMVSRPAAARAGRMSVPDLFQEGCLGLLTAVQRFDHRRGCRFATYALYWIRAFVGAASATRLGELNLPSSRAGDLRVVHGAAELVGQSLGRTATAADVAAAVGRSPEWTEKLLSSRPPESLDGSLSPELQRLVAPPDRPWQDRPDPDAVARDRLAHRLLAGLSASEREVIRLRLGFTPDGPQSRARIGARLGLSTTAVQRLEVRALDRLRGRCPVSARDLLSA